MGHGFSTMNERRSPKVKNRGTEGLSSRFEVGKLIEAGAGRAEEDDLIAAGRLGVRGRQGDGGGHVAAQ